MDRWNTCGGDGCGGDGCGEMGTWWEKTGNGVKERRKLNGGKKECTYEGIWWIESYRYQHPVDSIAGPEA